MGWHTIVWGQLYFLSPVDFVLPFRLGSTGLGLTKADNRNPQLAGIFYFFPSQWLELQAYFFPEIGIDKAFLDNINQGVNAKNNQYRTVQSENTIPTGSDAY